MSTIGLYKDELEQLALAFPERIGNLEIRLSDNGQMAAFARDQVIVAAVWFENEDEVVIAFSPDPEDKVREVACDVFVISAHKQGLSFREWEPLSWRVAA